MKDHTESTAISRKLSFCERISSLREHLGLNQEEMGAKFGVSRNYYSQLEGGKRRPSDSLARILDLLELVHTGRQSLDRMAFQRESPAITEEAKGTYMGNITISHLGTQSYTVLPIRVRLEAHFKDYLDAAERDPNGLPYAYKVVMKYLVISDFEEEK